MRRPRKTWHKVFFWVLLGIIAFGLVGSSVAGLWGMGGNGGQARLPAPGVDQPAGEPKAEDEPAEKEKPAEADPGDVNSLIALAVDHKRRLDYEKSIELFEKVVQLDPANQRARVDLAEMHFGLEDYDQAAAQLEALLRLNPEHRYGLYLYGIVLGLGKEDYPRAVQALERYLALEDTGADAEHARALIREWQAK